jgi:hypothetical protein
MISQGRSAACATPFDSAAGTSGTGIAMGEAPSASITQAPVREGMRIVMPASIGRRADLLVHRHDRLTAMDMEPHDLEAAVVVGQVVGEHVVHGEVRGADVVHEDAGQLEDLGARELPGV